jgi:chaperone modulatory protein CbpM
METAARAVVAKEAAMVLQAADWFWLDANRRVDRAELAAMCSLTPAEVDELVDYGGLVPLLEEGSGGRRFSASCVPPLREAMRLRGRYDLDLFTVNLLLGYLQKIVSLEQQVRTLQPHVAQVVVPSREGPTPWREPHA